MENIRRAALLLHSLGYEDRKWLLNKLSPDHRSSVNGLIEELRELGVSSFDAEVTISDLSRSQKNSVSNKNILNSYPLHVVSAVLKEEPNDVIGAVLTVAPSEWTNNLLAEFEKTGRKERIQKSMQDSLFSPRFKQALVSQLVIEVEKKVAAGEMIAIRANKSSNWFDKLRGAVGSWLL